MIPCKENKCLIFPLCKSKTVIVCSDLHLYYLELREEYYKRLAKVRGDDDIPNIESHKIADYLPKVIAIKEDHETEIDDYKFVIRHVRRKYGTNTM